jgi:hypothetical protein
MSHDTWAVKTKTAKEKRALFKIIGKRDRTAIYFHPDGTREEQFSVSTREADQINEQIR